MADIIHLLPDSVANQIAAGEVIQRPASVIKELLENSFDAGATEIQIWVQDAGKESIVVSDNGKGMSETDARLAFERHATSKIKEASDLYALHTMGFRGEALPSIAAVAQVELKTRTADDELGTNLMLSGSKIEEQTPVACQVGTTFKVKNLFFNVPARRRFLKSNQTELNNIMTEFERFALAHPEIRMSFYQDRVQQLGLRSETVLQRIVDMFGSKFEKQLLPVGVDTSIVKISGFVGLPESSRRRGARQFFFVNGRFMRHPYFHRAVCSVFEDLVKTGEQVPYFIYFEVDPSHIDVNIHPTKTEIKFEDEQAVWQILIASIREALAKFNAVPTIDFDVEHRPDIPVFQPNVHSRPTLPEIDEKFNPFKGGAKYMPGVPNKWENLYKIVSDKKQATEQEKISFAAESENSELPLSGHAPVSEQADWEEKSAIHYLYKNNYILTSVRPGLMIINRQRAQERILYDRILAQVSNGKHSSQRLIFPELLHLSPSQRVSFHSIEEELRSVGFDFASFKDGDISINAVPTAMEGVDVARILQDILEAVRMQLKGPADQVNKVIARLMAQKASKRTDAPLNNEGMNALIDDLFSCQSPIYTEGGKLIVSILPHDKIEAMFR